MSSHGTKVTTDPEGFNNPIQEGTGFVAKDSLAAESLNSGGSFAADNPNAAADPQGAHGSTATTTDTSAASTLDPAPSASERNDDDDVDFTGGAGKSEGRGPTYNVDSSSGGVGGSGSSSDSYSDGAGGSGSSSSTSYADGAQGSYSTSGSGADNYDNGGTAPSYVAIDRDSSLGSGPKGSNLQEGGFDDNAPNASFNSDIGGKNDPGRVAENEIEARNAQSAYDAGGSGLRQGGVSGDNQYSAIGNEQA